MELGGLFGEMGHTAKQASHHALSSPRSLSPALNNPRDIVFTHSKPVPHFERLKDESRTGSQADLLNKKPTKSDYLTVNDPQGGRTRSSTAPSPMPFRQKLFDSIHNLSEQVASNVNSTLNLSMNTKGTTRKPEKMTILINDVSSSERISVVSTRKSVARRESFVDGDVDKGYGAHRRASTDPGKLDVLSVGRRMSSNRRHSIIPKKDDLVRKIANMTDEACIQTGLDKYKMADIEDFFSASNSFSNLLGSNSRMSPTKPIEKTISSPKRSTQALSENKNLDTSQNHFKAIVQASVIMNSPTNMKNIGIKAAFYDELVANAEAETDEIKSLVMATRKAKMAPTPTIQVASADDTEDELVRSYRLKKQQNQEYSSSKEVLGSPLIPPANVTLSETKASETPSAGRDSVALGTGGGSVAVMRRPSMTATTAFSKLKNLMNNLVLPTVAKHLDDKKEMPSDGFDYNENIVRLKVLNSRVQQVMHGIFRDIQHENIEKQHEMSAMFTDNLATMKRLTREALEAEYAELLDENNLTKEIERLEAELTQVKGHLKQVLDHADKLQTELADLRIKKSGSKEEYELLLTDIGRLRIQNKALRAKVRKLEAAGTTTRQNDKTSRPSSAKSTTSTQVSAANKENPPLSEEEHVSDEEDVGSTPSLTAQWHKQQSIQEMNTRFSDGSLSSLVKTGGENDVSGGKMVDIDNGPNRDSEYSQIPSRKSRPSSSSTTRSENKAGGLVGDLKVQDIDEEEDDIKEYCDEYTPRKAWNNSKQTNALSQTIVHTGIITGSPARPKVHEDHAQCKEEIRKLKDAWNKERSHKRSAPISEATPRTKRISQLIQFLETCLSDVRQQEAIELDSHVKESEWIDAKNNPDTRHKVSDMLYEKQQVLQSILKVVDWHSHDIPKRSMSPSGHRPESPDHMIEYAARHLRPSLDDKTMSEFDSVAFATLVKSIKPTSPQTKRRPQSASVHSNRIPQYSVLHGSQSNETHSMPMKSARPSSASISRPPIQEPFSTPAHRPMSASHTSSTTRPTRAAISVSVPTDSFSRVDVLKHSQKKTRPCSAPVGSKRSSVHHSNPSHKVQRGSIKLNVVNVDI